MRKYPYRSHAHILRICMVVVCGLLLIASLVPLFSTAGIAAQGTTATATVGDYIGQPAESPRALTWVVDGVSYEGTTRLSLVTELKLSIQNIFNLFNPIGIWSEEDTVEIYVSPENPAQYVIGLDYHNIVFMTVLSGCATLFWLLLTVLGVRRHRKRRKQWEEDRAIEIRLEAAAPPAQSPSPAAAAYAPPPTAYAAPENAPPSAPRQTATAGGYAAIPPEGPTALPGAGPYMQPPSAAQNAVSQIVKNIYNTSRKPGTTDDEQYYSQLKKTTLLLCSFFLGFVAALLLGIFVSQFFLALATLLFVLTIAVLLYTIFALHYNGDENAFKEQHLKPALEQYFQNPVYHAKAGVQQAAVESAHLVAEGNAYHASNYIAGQWRNTRFEQSAAEINILYKDEDKTRSTLSFKGRYLIFHRHTGLAGEAYIVHKNFAYPSRSIAERKMPAQTIQAFGGAPIITLYTPTPHLVGGAPLKLAHCLLGQSIPPFAAYIRGTEIHVAVNETAPFHFTRYTSPQEIETMVARQVALICAVGDCVVSL